MRGRGPVVLAVVVGPTWTALPPRPTLSPFSRGRSGFHPDSMVSVYFDISGQAPYDWFVPATTTDSEGSFSITFAFTACGNSPDHLTITLADVFDAHASAPMTLC